MCSLCRLPVAKNHNFGQILTFWGLLYRPPFISEGQIWCAIADPRHTFTCEISSRWVYSVVLWRRKTPIFAIFGLRHLVMSPLGINVRTLNTGAQLQTFSYPTASKLFLYSNAFMAKSGARTVTFKSVTDRQTNKQTNRQKTQRSWPPRRRVKSERHQTWHSDRGPRACSCTCKTFGGLTHRFAARGTKYLGKPEPLNLKPP